MRAQSSRAGLDAGVFVPYVFFIRRLFTVGEGPRAGRTFAGPEGVGVA